MLGIVIVHFDTPDLLRNCVRSVLAHPVAGHDIKIVIVENGSSPAARSRLHEIVPEFGQRVELVDTHSNRGFAGGCNIGIRHALQNPSVSHVLLVNSDAELAPRALAVLLSRLHGASAPDMLAARVHRADRPAQVDSLGICMFSSGLASNRKDCADPLLGPTGGLALYSRKLIETLDSAHGHFFDPRFFCYAEDTDVACRALLLGFDPEYIDECLALHHGQASSGGGFNDFVLYHGIRNSLWVLAKDFPAALLLRLAPRIILLHCAIVARHCLRGRLRVLFRLYRDFFRGLPAMLRARRTIQGARLRPAAALRQFLSPQFYDRNYLRGAMREMLGRGAISRHE